MSLITNVGLQDDAAKGLLATLLRNQVPVIGVGTEIYPKQVLVVYVGQTVNAHALIPRTWSGYPVVVLGLEANSELN